MEPVSRALGPRRARLSDVAAAAGVSKSIASRVFNDPQLAIRPETRRRVLSAARELGYRPHAAARGLRRARTGAIALAIPDLTNPVWARIVRGAWERARQRDFALLLLEDLDDGEIEASVVSLLQAGRIDGLILASARPAHPLLPALGERGLPHVFLNRAVPGSGRNVVMDEGAPTALALEHLRALGHRSVGHVAGPWTLSTGRRRTQAFRAHARRLGLEPAPVVAGEFSERGGAEAAGELLGRFPTVSALTVGTLAQAVGVLHAAWLARRSVPHDLSLVVHDDLALACYLRPPLTRIRLPMGELGAAGVDALLDQLAGARAHDVHVPTHASVVAGGSTAPPLDMEKPIS